MGEEVVRLGKPEHTEGLGGPTTRDPIDPLRALYTAVIERAVRDYRLVNGLSRAGSREAKQLSAKAWYWLTSNDDADPVTCGYVTCRYACLVLDCDQADLLRRLTNLPHDHI